MNQYSTNFLEASRHFSSVVELLRYRSSTQPNRDAFTFLLDGETEKTTLTYQELDRQSRRIAAQLQALGLAGERALLLYPAGLDFLVAFFGCLYASVVAVTAYPPRSERNTPRIKAISTDAQAAIALTTTEILSTVQSLMTEKTDLKSLQWLTTDNLVEGIEDNWQEPSIHKDTLAFLQYTSGSTAAPKGVMISHGNLLHNAATTYQFMGHSAESKFVTWLPMYHDMGLIGGILQPLYGGFPCILMPPTSFLQRPARWLQAISHYQGTTSGAPNFAYELCIEKITPEQRSTLDLSSWSVAFNGAEPIRCQTLERFAKTFESCGFRKEAFYPCYGMAEATLMVSGIAEDALPTTLTVQKAGLERHCVIDSQLGENDSITLVSCGCALPDQEIAIANLDTLTRCAENEVGEIWVRGQSVGKGYWNLPQETDQTFRASFKDTGEGAFLRTGDLGFLHNGEIFITGRAKDLIIIRGRNLYPQDIELAAERSHLDLRSGSGAAFTVEVDNQERLVVVHELEFRAKPDLEEVIGAIRQAIAKEFSVQVYGVVLIKPGSIPKTSSGKIQRRATKAEFLAGTLKVIKNSILDSTNLVITQTNCDRESLLLSQDQRQSILESYLQQVVAQTLTIPLEQINLQQPLSNLGIDSLQVFDLRNRIQQDLEVSISAVDLFDTSITQLTQQLAIKLQDTKVIVDKLKPVPRNDKMPLCLAQERLWFLEQLEPGNPFYNVPIAIRLTGVLNLVTLEQSLNEIIKRHESLRTSFTEVEGRPIQVIHPELNINLSTLDLSIVENLESNIQSILLQETQQSFNLSQLPLLRAKLLRLKENEHLLLITMHHIISDGWSIGVLVRELAAVYEALIVGTSLLPDLVIQYADFAYWQRQLLTQEVLKTQLDYWKQQLRGNTPLLKLPLDRPRPQVQTFRGRKEFFTLALELKKTIKQFNQQEGVTLFMTLLAVFKTLLYCYSKQENISVGSPVVGRNLAETEGLIGFFINTLVFRTDLSGNPSFRELLQRIRSCALGAYAHQDLPFEKIVDELQIERNLSYNPLFQVMFILQNTSISSVEHSDLKWEPEEVDSGTSKFDLKLNLWESSKGINGSFEYKTDLFDATTINRMIRHFEMLLQHVLKEPEIQLKQLADILAMTEQHQKLIQEQQLQDISFNKLKLAKRTAIRSI